MKGLIIKAYKDGKKIGIEYGMLKLRKISGIYKDYGSSFYNVWSRDFINRISIIVFSFEATVPRFPATLTQFYYVVLHNLRIYN